MSIAPESLGGMKPEMRERRILILTVPHGASHDRAAGALKKALAEAQPEVDLYTVSPDGAQAQLKAAGVFTEKILACGMPVDPAFESLPDRAAARARLGARGDTPLVLVLFGGSGTAKPHPILTELEK